MSSSAPTYPFSEPEGLTLDPTYSRLRREEPVTWVKYPYGGEGWLVTTYKQAKFVYGDPRFSKALGARDDIPRMLSNVPPPGSIASTDGADLARLRRLTFHAFTPRRVEELRPRAQEIADDLLDHLDNPDDLVTSFTSPLTLTVTCELLGVPFEERDNFRLWAEMALTVDKYTPGEAAEGMAKLGGYIAELVTQRRATPTDDLLGALVAARDDGDMLTDHEIVIFQMTMLVAGLQSPTNQLGNIIVTLLDRPEAMAQLRDEPELLPGAIEELLRLVPLLTGTGQTRVATEDVRVGDVTVKKGQAVLVSLTSANRDESVFEQPDELDLAREAGQHLAFGYGSHYCPGAQLGRMQLQVGLGTLLRRFPELRLAEPVEFKKGGTQRGPRKLVVTW
ncbi:cytochrome P450 [Amycolatopsis sp. NPDC049868]|uniref:cytochrome P450 n=1 Tax=Amycolatopsis sp. NPDC049868 TaxID=3363934 RepID=UPI00378DFC29